MLHRLPYLLFITQGSQPCRQSLYHHRLPGREVAGDDVLACFAYEPEVEGEVVDGGYLHGQQLLRMEEVAQGGLGVERVYYRRTVGLDGREVKLFTLTSSLKKGVAFRNSFSFWSCNLSFGHLLC